MNHQGKIFKMILAGILAGGLIFISCPAIALEGIISGSVRDRSDNQGIQWVIITVKEDATGKVAETGVTDALGDYSILIPVLGTYSIEASKPGDGYRRVAAPDPVEISDTIPKQAVNLSMGGREWPLYTPDDPTSAMPWETGAGKSYLIPAMEISAFLFLLNGYDRLIGYPNLTENGAKVYDTNLSTFRDHVVEGQWGADTDAFGKNQFVHPYQGSIYHGFARSAGLTYWGSLLYTNVGSLLWETGGEITNPSINDQIAGGFGGSFFGESLFRMAGLVLECDGGKPGYSYRRPFDYFNFGFTTPGNAENPFDDIMTRDSSTSASLGTIYQWWLSREAAPQGTALVGDDPGGRETINRLNTEITARIYGPHALGLQYNASSRDAEYPARADTHQSIGTFSPVYTRLGKNRFGDVEWRKHDNF